jgi:hypothetical protein
MVVVVVVVAVFVVTEILNEAGDDMKGSFQSEQWGVEKKKKRENAQE